MRIRQKKMNSFLLQIEEENMQGLNKSAVSEVFEF